MFFRDSVLIVSVVKLKATALLLGASNDCFRTEILDILIGTLIFCFSRTFLDRSPLAIFLEGHGREPVDGMQDSDLSRSLAGSLLSFLSSSVVYRATRYLT